MQKTNIIESSRENPLSILFLLCFFFILFLHTAFKHLQTFLCFCVIMPRHSSGFLFRHEQTICKTIYFRNDISNFPFKALSIHLRLLYHMSATPVRELIISLYISVFIISYINIYLQDLLNYNKYLDCYIK